MTDMMLLPARQAEMRDIATGLGEDLSVKEAVKRIRRLIKMEQKSAEGSQATIDRSEHAHVQRSGHAALKNRHNTIEHLENTIEALKARDYVTAVEQLIEASNAGGKKSVKAARKQPTVALFVQYLAETDPDFQAWLATQGVRV